MIIKYNLYNESLRDKIKGKSKEEITKHLKGLSKVESLDKACKIGYLDLVKDILEKDKFDVSDMEYNTCIDDASLNGHTELVRYLLKDGRFNPSEYEYGAISLAASNGHLDIVKMLLKDSRVDPTEEDNNPISIASEKGYVDVVR